jgi:type I restriction enzyme S subunit
MSSPTRFKPYPAYKDSGVAWLGEIPAHWEIKRLKRVFRVVNGSTPASGEPTFWDGEIPWVTPEDLGELLSPTIAETRRNITAAGYRSCGTTIVPAGSLVLSTRAPIGHLAIAGMDLCSNQGCRSLVLRDAASRKFFFYKLLAARPELESLGQGSTFRELAKGTLENIGLASPPEPEQRVIAAFLDRETARIDALVAKKVRLIELLQEKRTALITRAVTKGLDPTVPMKDSGVEWLGGIPAHWDTTFLDKLIDPLRRITYGIVQPGEPDPEGIPMVRGQNYSRGWTPLEEIFRVSPAIEAPYRRARLKSGDIVMTIVGAGTGNVAIVPNWLSGANLTQTTARIALDMRSGDNRYFAYQLQSVVGTVSVELTVKGAAQPGLNLGHIAKYRVVVPPAPEQKRIADYLDRETAKLDTLVAKIHEAIKHLNEYRTALISAAVTGKIDVRHSAQE